MEAVFHAALDHVLTFEGGYSDHPEDPGGATNLGITLRVLSEHRGRQVTKNEVRALTKSEATEIYRLRYWNAASCDALPSGIDLAVFDCAVNQGVSRASRFIQQAAGVTTDGIVGPVTLAAIASADKRALLNEFMARRMRSYGLLQTLFRTFGLGWSRRLMTTHTAALERLDGAPRVIPVESPKQERFSMDYIIQRLREPSTYAGIAAFLASIGLLGFSEQEWNQLFGAFAAIAAALAILVKERPAQSEPARITVNADNDR